MVFEVLHKNIDLIDTLVKKGVVSYEIVTKYKMYIHFNELYQGNRRKKTEAFKITAMKYRCSPITVRRAVEFMES